MKHRAVLLSMLVVSFFGCGESSVPELDNLVIDNSYGDSYFVELPGEIEQINDIELDGFDYAVTGTGDSPSDLILMKLDWDLSSTWLRPFGGNLLDGGRNLKSTKDNGLIVAGFKSSNLGDTDAYLVRIDSMRQVDWELSFGNAIDEQAYSVVETSDNGFIYTGSAKSGAFDVGDVVVAKLDADGQELWSRTLQFDVGSSGRTVLEVQPELFLVSGTAFRSTDQGLRCFARIDTDGNVVDSIVLTLPGKSDLAMDIMTIQLRTSDLMSITTDGGFGHSEILLIRMSPSLTLLDLQSIGGSGSEEGNSIIEMANGDLLLLGTTTSGGNGNKDILMIRMNSDGDIKWTHTYGGSGLDLAFDVVENTFGSIVVAGYSASVQGPVVFKVDAAGKPE